MSKAATIDPKLREFGTETQQRYMDAVAQHGSIRAAARALEVGKSSIQDALGRLRIAAAARGYAPDFDLVHPVALGQMLKGTSTLYKDGQPVMQWVKTKADAAQLEELMRVAAAAMAEELPRVKPAPKPRTPGTMVT